MIPRQRRDLAAGNNFTFSSPAHKEEHEATDPSVEMEYDAWAERIKGQHNHFGKPNSAKFGAWTRRSPRTINPEAEGDGGSGTPSPEMWKGEESRVPQPQSAGSSPARSYGRGHITHSARAQTIAKYRQEMLDLVRGMPETAYELSLRDIVESPKITTPLQEEEKSEEGGSEDSTKTTTKKKEKKGVRKIWRSESLDAAPFLKMLIPKVPNLLGGRKSSGGTGTLGDGSPDVNRSEKGNADREWWSAEFGQMTGSSGSSGSSNSSGRGRRSGKLRGCYPFFQTR